MRPSQEFLQPVPTETSLRSKIIGLGTAVPPLKLTQDEVLEFVLKNFLVKESTRQLYRRTLQNKSIRTRHFALNQLSDVLDMDHERVNARFENAALQLSEKSLNQALDSAGLSSKDINYLVMATCTGYLCPGLAPQLIDRLKINQDIPFADLVGMGCAAAIPALQQAFNFTQAHPGSIAAVVSTEICSAAMFSNNEIDIVISNSIFSDGSAALIIGSSPSEGRGQERGEATGRFTPPLSPPLTGRGTRYLEGPLDGELIDFGVGHPRILDFGSLVIPEWKDTLRFRTEQGHLKNVLGKEVPQQAGDAVQRLAQRLLAKNGLSNREINHWMIHPGGEKVLQEVERRVGLTRNQTRASWEVLRDHGNMSSASVLFVLQKEMEINPPRPGEWGFLCSFGAGFSVHAAIVSFPNVSIGNPVSSETMDPR